MTTAQSGPLQRNLCAEHRVTLLQESCYLMNDLNIDNLSQLPVYVLSITARPNTNFLVKFHGTTRKPEIFIKTKKIQMEKAALAYIFCKY